MVGSNGDGVPDLNVIPPALIQNVEIITGGASSVYGSDAIAGVVNLNLRRTFDGIEVGGRWGKTGQNDGEEYDLSVTAGTPFADGRGQVMGYVGYTDRAQVNQGDRKSSRTSLVYLGPSLGSTGPGHSYVPVGSGATDEGMVPLSDANGTAVENLFASYGSPVDKVGDQREFGFNPDGTLFTMGDYTPGSVLNFRGVGDPLMTESGANYGYNFASTVALQMPLDRWSAFGSATYAINEQAEVYGQALYADYTVNTQFAPTPLQGVLMPVTNPYIPDDLATLLASRPDPSEPFYFLKRMSAVGPRIWQNNFSMYQATLGVRGHLTGDWDYDAYVLYGANQQQQSETNDVLRSKVMELTFAPDGGLAACGGFNPFGVDSVSAGCARYVSVNSANHARSDLTIAEATVNGPLAELPAGAARAAFGVMYRDSGYRYHASETLTALLPDGRPDVVGPQIADEIDAGDHNLDLYAELLVPLLRDATGAKLLDTIFGYRYSDYASAGAIGTWKAELVYQPVETVRMRGSYQRAVRAPTIYELYLPQVHSEGYFDLGEPCSEASPQRAGADAPQVEALCLAQGLPAALLPTFYDDTIPVIAGGNPELKPEYATTQTAGVVLQPHFTSEIFEDLQVSVDWYRIDIDNSALYVGATDAVANCFDPAFNGNYRPDNFWCTLFSRDPVTGEITGAADTYRNLATLGTSGIDTQLDWSFVAGPGRLAIVWYVSWVDSYEVRSAPGVPGEEFVGTVGGFAGSYPEWKWNFHVAYTLSGFTAGARWRYVDSMRDRDRTPGFALEPTTVNVPHFDYLDLEASYEFQPRRLQGLVLRAGVQNLTDRGPPVFPSAVGANTDPSQYDVLGRRYFVSLNDTF